MLHHCPKPSPFPLHFLLFRPACPSLCLLIADRSVFFPLQTPSLILISPLPCCWHSCRRRLLAYRTTSLSHNHGDKSHAQLDNTDQTVCDYLTLCCCSTRYHGPKMEAIVEWEEGGEESSASLNGSLSTTSHQGVFFSPSLTPTLTNLAKRLEAATSRLEDIASSVPSIGDSGTSPSPNGVSASIRDAASAVASAPAVPSPAAPVPVVDETPDVVKRYDSLIDNEVADFVDRSKAISPVLAAQVRI